MRRESARTPEDNGPLILGDERDRKSHVGSTWTVVWKGDRQEERPRKKGT